MSANANHCQHTAQAIDSEGQLLGSWKLDSSGRKQRIICGGCGKFFGYLGKEKTPNGQAKGPVDPLWQAYLEQQRRQNCPGCGEEPFLG